MILKMTEDYCCNLVSKEVRCALSDMTNVPSKRDVFSGDLLRKSGDESDKSERMSNEDSRMKFSKKLCLVVDDFLKKTSVTEVSDKSERMSNEDSRMKFSKKLCLVVDDLVKKTSGKEEFDKSKTVVGKESRESRDTFVQRLVDYSDDDDDEMEIDGEECNELNKDCNPSSSLQMDFEFDDRDRTEDLNLAANRNQSENNESQITMVRSDIETSEHQELPSCQNFRSFQMSKCSNVKATGQEQNQNVSDDLLKSCSCSFCLKAAFILADIHYQDIKGRLHALKMSQKAASNAIQRNDVKRPKDFRGASDPICTAKTVSQLNSQLRPLFLNMRDTIASEINDLVSAAEPSSLETL